MSANQLALWYLVAAVSFILALKGLSSPPTARRGNLYGMIGMAIALLVTLAVGISASGLATGFGFVALVLVSVNIFGGFLVTQRMLAMYKKKEK